MAISFVAAGAVATGTNPVVTVPAGVEFSDLLVLTVSVGAAVAPSTPSGWILLGSTTTTPRIYIYTKFAGATESSVTLSVASSTVQAVMCAYRGVSALDTLSTFASATSTTIATNTLTTTYVNEYVVSVYAMTTGEATWTAPGSTTERVNAAGTAALSGLLIVDELQAAAGVSAARTATSSVSKALSAGSFSIIVNDRYWVGGTNNWDGTAGFKWSFTSGGTAGAPVPTSRDDVFLDASSGAVTCTISGSRLAKTINCTGFTGTLAGASTPALTISGSLTLAAGMTLTYNGTTTFNGTGTITSAGKTLGAVTVNGSEITVTLGDALNIGSAFGVIVTNGNFTTSNYNVTAGSFSSNNSTNTRVITLGSSTITITSAGSVWSTSTNQNFTLNAGTSTLIFTSSSQVVFIADANQTFNDISSTGTGNFIISVRTVNNLSITGPSSAGYKIVQLSIGLTVNGVLSTTGTAGNRRVWFQSSTYGIAHTLTVNGTPSLTDADFRDLYVVGTAAPISGTRIGDLRGCRGITFSTPKTVYWNLAGAQNWSANGWALTETGTPSTDNFPLAQDTATFTNSGSVTGAISLDGAIPYVGTVDMSGRTSAMTLNFTASTTIYGDWKNGSGTTIGGGGNVTFSGRNTQTITAAGKTFTSGFFIDTFGGVVQLADALNIGTSSAFTVTNGAFDTKNFNLTAQNITASGTNVSSIVLGSSTVTLAGAVALNLGQSGTNITFNAGTSQINFTSNAAGNLNFNSGGLTFYNVSFTGTTTAGIFCNITGTNTFNNITVNAPSTAGFTTLTFNSNQTINGTLTVAGASPVRRIFVQSNTLGTTRTLTVNSLVATDCDFRDITIAGAAAGSSPTRAGDCGGNSGITFPAAKTVYWNLSGAQNWSATAWATGSGGTPNINNFPLAQDTAVFDNAANSVTGTISFDVAWNVGTVDMSARTSAMTLSIGSVSPRVYGDWKFGTGVTSSDTAGTLTFSKYSGTQTITSNGISFNCNVDISGLNSTTQLADAFSVGGGRQFGVIRGTFDAVSYNVTVPIFASSTVNVRRIKMGSGTWTISGTGTCWLVGSTITLDFYKGTADILLSNNTVSSRTFDGGGLSYNKLTIGGTTSTSTTTISGNNQFTELASTKTVAHTIALGTTAQTFGKWTVTGTVGNVVTLTGTGTSHHLAGACTSGIDYLAMGSIGFAATSPGEFYAGANSTGTAGAPVYRTVKPADSTRYWVGGTGNWSDTARWSADSGGTSGASVPRSHDDVVFNSSSNATAYTATVNTVTGGARCKSLTITGPASGNVTLAGSVELIIHNNVSLPATGLTRTYTGQITLSGSTTGRTFTTNGVSLGGSLNINGVDCGWTLGSALTTSSAVIVSNGNFSLSTYNLNCSGFISDNSNSRTIDFGSATVSVSGLNAIRFNTTETARANLTFIAGTSQINMSGGGLTFEGNNQTFYNVSHTTGSSGITVTWTGQNTFNNLTFQGITSAGLKTIALSANQTVTGTLTFSAGTNATMRQFCRSDTIGTTRTITAAAVSMTDVDFRDITIAGAAAPASGTRIGDCKGNSGITFTTPKTVYWNLAAGGNWDSNGWAANPGDTPNLTNFPLAQDTCVFGSSSPNSGTNITINAAYNIGTIDMSGRTTNTMGLNNGSVPLIYGNWINGTGTSLIGSGLLSFVGRGTQTITSAGKTFTQQISINSPNGSVVLQDSFICSYASGGGFINVNAGTLDSNNYNLTSTSAEQFNSSGSSIRTIAIGSGTWSIGGAWSVAATNLTVTGTGTIKMTGSASKIFGGGGVNYGGITLDQAGAGTLTITGNNTFKDVTNSYKSTGAATISLSTTTQRLSQFTAAGEAGRLLTLTGTSAASPATFVLTGAGTVNSDYLTITGIRAFPTTSTWYAGTNSTNNGSLGWLFESALAPAAATSNFFMLL